MNDPEFIADWDMEHLASVAKEKLGPISGTNKYCLKIPGILGGEYGADNLGIAPLKEMLLFSGDIAYQIQHLPDGTQINFRVRD